MPAEDEIEIPDAWRYVVHPRRHGMSGLESARGPGESFSEQAARRAARGVDLQAERERVLDHPDTDPALAALCRSDDRGIAADAVRLALAPSPMRAGAWFSESLAPIDDLVRDGAYAAASFVTSVPPAGIQAPPLVQRSEAMDTGETQVRDRPAARHDAARCSGLSAPKDRQC